MTLLEIQRLAARLSMRPGWPWPVRFAASVEPICDRIQLQVTLTAACVVTGDATTVHQMEHISVDDLAMLTEADAAGEFRMLLRMLVEHELDEHLTLDDKHVRDPHPQRVIYTTPVHDGVVSLKGFAP